MQQDFVRCYSLLGIPRQHSLQQVYTVRRVVIKLKFQPVLCPLIQLSDLFVVRQGVEVLPLAARSADRLANLNVLVHLVAARHQRPALVEQLSENAA